MTKIHIKEFNGYSKNDWLKFLHLQNTTAFDFCIPKNTVEHIDDDEAILIEYFIAAFIAQELASVAGDFLHNLPRLDRQDEFSFIIITPDVQKLSVTLSMLSNGFNDLGDPIPQFLDYALSFLDRLGDDDPVYCELYLNVCRRFSGDPGSPKN